MKTTIDGLAVVTSAVRGTLIAAVLATGATPAWAQQGAQDEDLTRPISTFEGGATGVSADSFKAGEFNGLYKKGGLPLGNFDLRGGAAFDSDSAWRWRLRGTDLGFEGRSISADLGVQGIYRLTIAYSELLRNNRDTYQLPFAGGGSANLTLPGVWLPPNVAGSSAASPTVNVTSARGLVPSLATQPFVNLSGAGLGSIINPTTGQLSFVNAAAGADLGLFQNYPLSTKRTRLNVAFDYHFTPRWGLNVDVRPEHRDGAKPLGVNTRATGGDISATVPDPIDTNHQLGEAAVFFKGKKAFAQVAYMGSYFRNNIPSFTYQNWALGPASPATNMVVSSTPNTNYSQIHVMGNYRKSSVTTFSADAEYGRNTQNDRLLTDVSTPVVPITNTGGIVVNTAAHAKVTTRLGTHLHASAAYKYDDRDNQTPVSIIQFMDANQALAPNASFPAGPNNPLGAVLATNAGATRSYRKTLNQVTGDLNYRISGWQTLSGGYDLQLIDRSCPGSWITCASVARTNENAFRADWRASVRDDLVARAGYTNGVRRGTPYNENAFLALVPYANVSPAAATGGMTYYQYLQTTGLNGWGPALGFAPTTGNANVFFPGNSEAHLAVYAWENRIAELPGMRRYEFADRNRDRVRASLDWQATEMFSLRVGGNFDRNDYLHSRYGLTSSGTRSVNADSSYTFEDRGLTLSGFYTYEDLRSANAGNTLTNSSNATNVNGFTGLSNPTGCASYANLQARNNNNKLDPCLDWTTDHHDKVHTIGFQAVQNVDALTVTADVNVSTARGDIGANGGVWVNNPQAGPGAPQTNIAAYYIPAAPLPAVKTDSIDVRVRGRYAMGPRTSLLVQYAFQHMTSDDWAYQGLQLGMGTIVNVLPTNEQPFNYDVHSFAVSYVYGF